MKNNKKQKRKKKYGFTLIEIVTVITIIGVLASIVVPSVNNYVNDAKKVRVKEQARELVAAVEVIRLNEKLVINDEESIQSIKSNSSNKLVALNKYIGNVEELNKIINLNLGDARKIVKDIEDFEVNKNGEFLKINN